MKRMKLLSLQILVMLVFLAIWHVVTTTSLFGDVKTMQFFFSTPSAVLTRTFKQLTSGDIYYHLGITLTETVLAFVIGFAIEKTIGFRIKSEDEIAGIDTVVHGEEGYVLADA